MTEAEALERLIAGDDTVISYLYDIWCDDYVNRHFNKFNEYCPVSREGMEDYFLEALSVLAAKAKRGELADYQGQVGGYLYLFMLNQHRTYCRKYQPTTLSGIEERLSSQDVTELQLSVRQALNQLTRRCAEMLRLRFMEGLSNSEVGWLLNLAADTVRNQLPKCKKAFRQILGFKNLPPL